MFLNAGCWQRLSLTQTPAASTEEHGPCELLLESSNCTGNRFLPWTGCIAIDCQQAKHLQRQHDQSCIRIYSGINSQATTRREALLQTADHEM